MTTGSPELTDATIRQYASAGAFERGRQYYRQGAVLALTRRGALLQAEVEGSGSYSPIEQVTDAALASRPDWVVRASYKLVPLINALG